MRANYLITENPFNLAPPPAWFLTALRAYDAALVLFPSVKEPLYRMGRYGRYGHGLLSALQNNPDTAIFVAHRIWPWKSILPQALGADWNRILLEIPNYDTQQFRDPGAQIDAVEDAAESAETRRMLDVLDAMNGDTYRTMKLMTGQRVGAGIRPEGAGYRSLPGTTPGGRRRPPYRPLGAGAGAIYVGR